MTRPRDADAWTSRLRIQGQTSRGVWPGRSTPSGPQRAGPRVPPCVLTPTGLPVGCSVVTGGSRGNGAHRGTDRRCCTVAICSGEPLRLTGRTDSQGSGRPPRPGSTSPPPPLRRGAFEVRRWVGAPDPSQTPLQHPAASQRPHRPNQRPTLVTQPQGPHCWGTESAATRGDTDSRAPLLGNRVSCHVGPGRDAHRRPGSPRLNLAEDRHRDRGVRCRWPYTACVEPSRQRGRTDSRGSGLPSSPDSTSTQPRTTR